MTTTTTYCPCGARTKGYPKCYKCQLQAAREEGYELGLSVGSTAMQGIVIDLARWRQLTQLCHPDKHGDSTTAKDVMQWLQSIKPASA